VESGARSKRLGAFNSEVKSGLIRVDPLDPSHPRGIFYCFAPPRLATIIDFMKHQTGELHRLSVNRQACPSVGQEPVRIR
jgi:hypothetical protein